MDPSKASKVPHHLLSWAQMATVASTACIAPPGLHILSAPTAVRMEESLVFYLFVNCFTTLIPFKAAHSRPVVTTWSLANFVSFINSACAQLTTIMISWQPLELSKMSFRSASNIGTWKAISGQNIRASLWMHGQLSMKIWTLWPRHTGDILQLGIDLLGVSQQNASEEEFTGVSHVRTPRRNVGFVTFVCHV
jgi:hypothetical protein